MGRHLRISVSVLLLLLQGLHNAALQQPSHSSRQHPRHKDQHKNKDADQNVMKSTDDHNTGDHNTGLPPGSMLNSTEEFDQIQDQDVQRTDVSTVTMTMLPELSTTDPAQSSESTRTPAAHTTILLNASQPTHISTESHNTTTDLPDITTHPFIQSSDGSLSNNDTDLIDTTIATDVNVTNEATPDMNIDNSVSNNSTEDNDVNATRTEKTEFVPSTTANLTTSLLPETTTVNVIIPKTTTVSLSPTPETTAMAGGTTQTLPSTDIGTASGSNSERGFASDVKKNKRSEAWGAILGTAVVVAFVGLVVYIILKRKGQRDFTHRKLVEEFPADPVLRLDNSEPLDLKYDGSAYYNPGLQGDNIQMTNFPQGK